MIELIKKELHLYLKSNFTLLCIGPVAILAFLALVPIVKAVDSEPTGFFISTLMAFVYWIIISMVSSINYGMIFSTSISFGMTRKDFIKGYVSALFLMNCISAIFIYLWCHVEGLYLKLFNLPIEEGIEILIRSKYFLFFPLAITVLQLFCGIMFYKSKNSYWVIYCLGMATALISSKIGSFVEEHPDSRLSVNIEAIGNALSKITFLGWTAILVIVLFGLMTIGIGLLRRQEVRY